MSKHKNPSHGSAHDAEHDAHRPNVKVYIAVFAALMVLTCVTVLISKFHLPRPQAIALGLLVASVKAALVAGIFMHLWGENKLIHKAIFITVGCGAILVIPMIDFVLLHPRMQRREEVALQHPAEGGEEEKAQPAVETPKMPSNAEAAKPAKAKPAGKKK